MADLELAGLKIHFNHTALTGDSPPNAAVVLLHGYGAPGTDLVSLGDVLDVPVGTAIFFPEGPIDLSQLHGPQYAGARAWWPIDMVRIQVAMMTGQFALAAQSLASGLTEARIQLVELIDQLEAKFGLSSSRIVLGGFSQGAVAALDVALRDPREFAGLVLMSGTMVSEEVIREAAPRRLALPTLLSHGRSDPVLPFSIAEALRDQLVSAGWQLTWVPFSGGHGIPLDVLRAVSSLLLKCLR